MGEISNSTKSIRYTGLDILKMICAFFVVSIHVHLSGSYVPYYIAVTRVAVPVFFIITGFFYDKIRKRGGELKQIKKIAFMVLWSNLFFLLWKIIVHTYRGNLDSFFASVFNMDAFKNLVLYNATAVCGHLWYLCAILYVLIIEYFAQKLKITKLLYILTPLLLITDQIIGNYAVVFLGHRVSALLVRNFLFTGLPYFYIGKMLFGSIHKILEIKNVTLWSALGCIIFTVTCMLEKHFLIVNNAVNGRDHAISITFLAVCLFVFFVAFYQQKRVTPFEAWVADFGHRFSFMLYIIHPVFIRIVKYLIMSFGVSEYDYKYVGHILVYITTIGVILLFNYCKEKCCKIRKNGV